MRSELRPHQTRAVHAVRESLLAGNRRPMVQLPTGAGKTIMAAAMVDSALRKGNRVMFVVPAISLINQTVQAFVAEGITDIGVIQADHPMTDYSKPVQIASIQTIQRRELGKLPYVEMVLIDEAHKWFEFMGDWFDSWNGVVFVGLSATPWAKGLGNRYDNLIVAATIQELIDAGYLSDFRVYAPAHPDLSGVKTVAGDYNADQLADVMGEAQLVSGLVANWIDKAEGRPTLAFCVDRAHARKVQKDFIAAGVCAEYIDAYTDVIERERIARRFHAGEVKVVCNVGCLTTGVDWDVRCILLARPTKSEILFTQMIGRGLRTAEGKDYCLILDHSDTHLRLGFVTDICHTELDTGEHRKSTTQEREEPLPKECASCGVLKAPREGTCHACGFKAEKQSEIAPAEGELAELSRAQRKNNREFSADEKSFFYGELQGYARDKGYKPGWSANKYRERFGVWPNKHKGAPARDPSPETLKWIRHSQIRFAKSKGAKR